MRDNYRRAWRQPWVGHPGRQAGKQAHLASRPEEATTVTGEGCPLLHATMARQVSACMCACVCVNTILIRYCLFGSFLLEEAYFSSPLGYELYYFANIFFWLVFQKALNFLKTTLLLHMI